MTGPGAQGQDHAPAARRWAVVGLALVLLGGAAGMLWVLGDLLDGGGVPGVVTWPLWLLAVLYAGSEQVRVNYRARNGGTVSMSLGTFLWAMLLPVAAPAAALGGAFLGLAAGLLVRRSRPERFLFNVAENALVVTAIWLAFHALPWRDPTEPFTWATVVVLVVAGSTIQVPLIVLAMRVSGAKGTLMTGQEILATLKLSLLMAVFGMVSAILLQVDERAVVLVFAVVASIVVISELLEARGVLVHDLETERDDKDHHWRHDPLTDLANRGEFVQTLDSVVSNLPEPVRDDASGADVAVLLLDLNRFRDVNETLGHDVGDQLLVEVAHRLRTVARDGDFVGRLGGDEYAVLIRDVADEGGALGAAGRILRALEKPYEQDGLQLETGASIGIALAPIHGRDATTLVRRAEIAMYAAKDAGLGIVVYEHREDVHTPKRLRLVGQLRRAIDDELLTVAYQPKVDLVDGKVIGVEALARWTDSEDGFISPGEFIPVAERTGLIHRLTRLVIDRAFADTASWASEGVVLGVAVNVSPRVLLDQSFTEYLATRILQHGLSADRVTLEVTESVVISESARIEETLAGLEQLGVRLSIDDYGTGYSSLSYLRRLQVDELKIDRSFVMGLIASHDDEVLVDSTIKLGHALGLKVVAEGVEDAATLERLRELGCDVAQGYHLGRPMPATEVIPVALRFGVRAL